MALRHGYMRKDLIDRERVLADIDKQVEKTKLSITQTCYNLGAKSSGWYAAFKNGSRNVEESILEKLKEASGRRSIAYYLKPFTPGTDAQMKLDLKTDNIEEQKVPADTMETPEPDPQFMALCLALYNVYCSGFTTEISFKITKH